MRNYSTAAGDDVCRELQEGIKDRQRVHALVRDALRGDAVDGLRSRINLYASWQFEYIACLFRLLIVFD